MHILLQKNMEIIKWIWYQLLSQLLRRFKNMEKENIRLYDLVNIHSTSDICAEIKKILSMVDPSLDPSLLEGAYNDIVLLFNGKYPGYRASNTKYHNLEHTCAVTLATARFIHGLQIQGQSFSPRVIQLGIFGALFHDTGLIQTDDEDEGTGAQYTIGHEDRSIDLMEKYLSDKGLPEEDILDCKHIILCTRLSISVDDIPFNSKEVKTMGKVLGSADLVAQMADRIYLERLPLLFQEFKEAGIEGYETPLELFQNTEDFYRSVAITRLTEELSGVSYAALYHFRKRWDIDRDLYAESMKNNIRYMKKVTKDCDDSYECLMKKIRRSR